MIVQVESVNALANLEAITDIDGVDGVFFGPTDLSASMGLLGKPMDPAVRSAIAAGIATVRKAGKAAGTLASDANLAQEYLNQGATFVAVGVDTTILVKAASDLALRFKARAPASAPMPNDDQLGSVY